MLVNNAGVGADGRDRGRVRSTTFRDAMEINVTALWHLSKLVAPAMIAAGGGSIVNVASMLGHVGSTPIKQAHYCASKGAVVNLTRELALQWARKGVRVNALCPGWFPSEMTAGMETDESSQQFIETMSPIPRMGYEHELDGALLFLAGDASTFMTGQSSDRRRRLDRPLGSPTVVSRKALTTFGLRVRSAACGRPRAARPRAVPPRGSGRPRAP